MASGRPGAASEVARVAMRGIVRCGRAVMLAVALSGCGEHSPGPPPSGSAPPEPAAPTAGARPHGVGVVQSVDAAAGTVTIAHQPIESIGWPAMTMPFKVAKPDLLEQVSVGEKVEFTLDGKDMSASITSLSEAH